MKVIFLDIDGVLNDGFTILGTGKDFPTKDHLDCLRAIVDATEAQIVLSSSWRYHKSDFNDAKNALRNVGLAIMDKTKLLPKGRGAEISEWLSRHPEVDSYVILDDHNDSYTNFSADQQEHLVLTEFSLGLLQEHVQQAINILNKKELAIIKPEGTLISAKKEV
jgi:hypothetical protein